MKAYKFLGLLLLSVLSITAFAQNEQGMEFFHGTWEEAKAEAKKEKKYIFVDVYTTWCGPCKKMSKYTFTDASVGDFYNEHFINFKIDAEKGEGPSFASEFKVRAYPTLLYFNSKGDVVSTTKGYRTPDQFLEEGRKLFVNKETLDKKLAEFEKGNNDKAFLSELVGLLNVMGMPNKKVQSAYLNSLSDEELMNEENSQLIFKGADNINSVFYDKLIEKRAHFEQIMGAEKVSNKIRNSAISGINTAIEEKDESIYKKSVSAIEGIELENKDLLIFQMGTEFYKGVKDWKSYGNYATNYLAKNDVQNSNILNNVAWAFYENINSKKQLKLAEEWVTKSIAIKSDYHNNDTYAAILYKLGKIDEAYAAAEKAITIAKYSRKDYSSTTELMEKINNERFK